MTPTRNARRHRSLPIPLHVRRGSKPRPALVLFDAGADVVVCRVTSVARSGPLGVPLAGWRAAGLVKPSVARLDRLATIERTIIVRQLGALSVADLAAIRTTWNRHMRL